MATIKTFRAPAATNLGSSIGYVVYKSTTDEVVVSTDPTQAAQCPIGVIVDAANAAGGIVSVCVAGECKARAGAAITVGTHNLLMADGDGEVIPATANNWAVGFFIGKTTAADNDLVDIIVAPSWYEA